MLHLKLSHSHEDIVDVYNLKDNGEAFVRGEFTSEDLFDIESYKFNLDEDVKPDWLTDEKIERWMEWCKVQVISMFITADQKLLIGGTFIVKGCKVKSKYAIIYAYNSTVEAYNNSTVEADNSTVKAYNSTVKAYNSTVEAYNSTVKAYNNSTVKAYNSTVEAYNSTVEADNSTVKAYNSTVKAYNNSTVEADNSTVKAYNNSTVEATESCKVTFL
jgi:uncharacterized protein YukE